MSSEIRVNGEKAPVPATIGDLLAARGILEARGVAVAVNGAVVPRRSWSRARLQAGDEVEIIKVVSGG